MSLNYVRNCWTRILIPVLCFDIGNFVFAFPSCVFVWNKFPSDYSTSRVCPGQYIGRFPDMGCGMNKSSLHIQCTCECKYQSKRGLFDLKNHRAMSACTSLISVITRERSDIVKHLVVPSGKLRVHPLAVVRMTTANGMHSMFSGRHPKLFDNFRYFPIFTDFLRKLPKSIRPLLDLNVTLSRKRNTSLHYHPQT